MVPCFLYKNESNAVFDMQDLVIDNCRIPAQKMWCTLKSRRKYPVVTFSVPKTKLGTKEKRKVVEI